jgi:uncharacterized protein
MPETATIANAPYYYLPGTVDIQGKLTADCLTKLAEVFRSEPAVVAAWLFGSVAQARATALSDVDFAVLLRPDAPEGLDRFVLLDRLARKLADVLGVNERGVDVTALNEQGVVFQHNVLRTGRLLYERDPRARMLFVWGVLQRYLDFQPTLAIFDRARRRQAEGRASAASPLSGSASPGKDGLK